MRLIDFDYIENYTGETWAEQKKELIKKYEKKLNKKVKITRTRTDTKGLRSFMVEVKE